MHLLIRNIFLLFILTASISTANAGKWGVGLNLGKTTTSGFDTRNKCYSCQTEDSNSSQGAYITYNYNQAYGLELGHAKYGDYFTDGVTANFISVIDDRGFTRVIAVPTRFSVKSSDVKATYLAATAKYQFSKKLTATGRMGIASLKQQKTINFIDFQKIEFVNNSSNKPIFSASLDYNITDSFKVGVRIDGIDIFYKFGLNLHMSF